MIEGMEHLSMQIHYRLNHISLFVMSKLCTCVVTHLINNSDNMFAALTASPNVCRIYTDFSLLIQLYIRN